MSNTPRIILSCLIAITFAACEGELVGDLDTRDPVVASDAGTTPDGTGANAGTSPDGGDDGSDVDIGEMCGDGVISGAELCDGDCPSECDDGNSCTTDSLSGQASTCDVRCSASEITECVDGDGCCANGCDAATDDDCSASCGDGVVDELETCDGNCPGSCDDGDACTVGQMTGTPQGCNVQCSTTAVTACVDADGCCPAGCTNATDADCAAVCGNGVLEAAELCDGDCPSDCDDGMACTADLLSGSPATCDATCSNTLISQCVSGDGCCPPTCNQINDSDCPAICGNDIVEMGESCDGACPSCDDGVACTNDSTAGSAATCDVVCTNAAITACIDGDGCCAPGCDSTTDDDCNAVCGNGVIESGETCDPVASCPTACDDSDACTSDTLVGAAASCDAVCMYAAITMCLDGDGCCAPGCNATNDDDCMPMCGNSVLESGETCDPVASCPTACDDSDACTTDTLTGAAASCTAECSYATVTACVDGDGCCPATCNYNNDDDCPVVIDCTDAATWPSGWATLEDQIFAETNVRRTQPQTCGGAARAAQPAFTMSPQLQEAARCHALDMITNNFFSHTGSNGSSPGDRIDLTGYLWSTWGENIAAGNSTAVAILDQWMNSTGHCENIMNGNFEQIGVGYGYDAGTAYRHYSVQTFGTPR